MNPIFDIRWIGKHGIGRFAEELFHRVQGFSPIELKTPALAIADPMRLAKHLRNRGTALYYTPGFNAPLVSPCEVVLTLHDLIHLDFRSEFSVAKHCYYHLLQKRQIERSQLVVTVSQFSKQRIVDRLAVPPEKILVLGNGVSTEFVENGRSAEADKPYFLVVSNSKPHKNLPMFFKAFARVQDLVDFDVVLICSKSSLLERVVCDLHIDTRVRFFSNLDDAKLAEFYRGAHCLVFPSLYEGFGLPAIEAMSCGCPVLSSNVTSLPEIVGDAGLYFDPNNVEELADLMRSVAVGQWNRAELKELGLQRCKLFRWDRIADQLASALNKTYGTSLITKE